MSRTLTLVHAGWESVRQIAARGRHADALHQLTLLLARPDLPSALVAEGHRLAGELALALDRYSTARRHLKAAAALEPEHAATRYLCGRAWEEDPDGCDRRAAICFRKAATLEPTSALYRAAFGRAAARCGKVKFGAREMLGAAADAPGDGEVIRLAVRGLLEVGKPGEARRVLARAKFLRPDDRELAMLWERVKFETARLTQRKMAKTREATRHAQDAPFATDGDRVVLPFVRIADTRPARAADGGTMRRDTISFPRPHFPRLLARKADR
jgi:tetratricopeptide (TPR) repeat protein